MRLLVAAGVVLGLFGCGVDAPQAANDEAVAQGDSALSGDATVTFNADGSITGPGRLLEPGEKLLVRYHADRNPCVGATELAAGASVDGGNGTSLFMGRQGEYFDSLLTVLPAQQLSLWFSRVDAQRNARCWDSNGGANFNFPIQPRRQIHFEADGSVTGPSPLLVGERVVVRYESARNICRARGEDGLVGGFSPVGGHAESFQVSWAGPDYVFGSFVVPDAHHVALWFTRTNFLGKANCWDSNNGANYVFAVAHP